MSFSITLRAYMGACSAEILNEMMNTEQSAIAMARISDATGGACGPGHANEGADSGDDDVDVETVGLLAASDN